MRERRNEVLVLAGQGLDDVGGDAEHDVGSTAASCAGGALKGQGCAGLRLSERASSGWPVVSRPVTTRSCLVIPELLLRIVFEGHLLREELRGQEKSSGVSFETGFCHCMSGYFSSSTRRRPRLPWCSWRR